MTEATKEKPVIKTELIDLTKSMSDEERTQVNELLEQAKKSAAEEKPETQEPPKDPGPCPRCGFKEGKEKPNPEDAQEYMRSTLGGRRFTKVYRLMNGQLEITFRTVDTAASERMNKVLQRLGENVDDPVDFRAYIMKLQLIYMLAGFKMMNDAISFEVPMAETPEEVDKVFTDRFGSIDESLTTILTRTSNSFVDLKKALVEECFDENFYKGAGPF